MDNLGFLGGEIVILWKVGTDMNTQALRDGYSSPKKRAYKALQKANDILSSTRRWNTQPYKLHKANQTEFENDKIKSFLLEKAI